jgi:hypothetical protein
MIELNLACYAEVVDLPQLRITHFGSLLMLAVRAGAFLLVTWVATKALFFFLQEAPIP